MQTFSDLKCKKSVLAIDVQWNSLAKADWADLADCLLWRRPWRTSQCHQVRQTPEENLLKYLEIPVKSIENK